MFAPKILQKVFNHGYPTIKYKIVSGFSLKLLETQPLITMQNLIGILILKQLVGLTVTIMKFLVINGVLLKV